jgi:exosortase
MRVPSVVWRRDESILYREQRNGTLRRQRLSHILDFLSPHSSVGYWSQVMSGRGRPFRSAREYLGVLQAGVVLVLVGWLYGPILLHLIEQWWGDPNFSYGFLVPLFSLFVVWTNRAQLAKTPLAPSLWGLLILTVALCLLVLGVMGSELFLSRVSLLLLIAALVIFFFGWARFRAILFPWALLILMIPVPTVLFSQITFSLQVLASKFATATLPLAGVPVLREGNIIHLPAISLEVAEACSGIRSLLSLTTLAIIYGYLTETRTWVRVVLATAAIPVAVFANSLRIFGTGLMVQYWDPDKAEGFFHLFSGWLIFVVALAMLFLLHRFLRPGRDGQHPK